jgi:hypothetical protein
MRRSKTGFLMDSTMVSLMLSRPVILSIFKTW